MWLTDSVLAQTIEDGLLQVQINAIAHDKAALVQTLNTRLLLGLSRLHVGLGAEDSFQFGNVALLRVQIELTNDDILVLLGRPPSILDRLEKGPSAKRDLFRHFVDAWLACHSNGHVEVHGVPDHELIGGCGALAQNLRHRVGVLIQSEHVDQIEPTNHCRGWIALRESRHVLANHRVVLAVGRFKSFNLIWSRLL